MINQNTLSGLGIMEKPKPLISFRVLIDEDISLIKYVIKKYNKSKHFDLMDDIRSKSYFDILYRLQIMEDKNPLYLLSTNHSFMDQIYAEIMDPHDVYLYKILSHGVTTGMYDVLLEFLASKDIIPKVLCYNEVELSILEDSFKTKGLGILLDDVNPNQYTQFYLEYVDDIEPFKHLKQVTFYFSSKKYNFDGEDILRSDFNDTEVENIIKNGSHLSVFDMYNFDVFKETKSYKEYQERKNKNANGSQNV